MLPGMLRGLVVPSRPAESNGRRELYLMCDDVRRFIAEMSEKNVETLGVHLPKPLSTTPAI